jgi:hypothetical protein
MSTPWRPTWPRILTHAGLHHQRLGDSDQQYGTFVAMVHERTASGTAPVRVRDDLDRAVPPDPGRCFEGVFEVSRSTAPRSTQLPVSRTSEEITSQLNALYALAYLSSGDPERAQQVVVDAFRDEYRNPTVRPGGLPHSNGGGPRRTTGGRKTKASARRAGPPT